ncbi:hypothetical protein [Gordonia sp. 852002-50395_SCH5434458]|uniref:hypothetical protein n=1 Tax=Gordonia sp. 852002-50395_SCH5434458 TaxID=1834090 RepID=UPI0007E9BA47|nr:hypothetical protein [Gordonia sp. 852002-50395_SCH5434458]OBC01739.1 hypothetical protein A5785_17220 [Gordonia sp. 852002-50395_SCH5434458]
MPSDFNEFINAQRTTANAKADAARQQERDQAEADARSQSAAHRNAEQVMARAQFVGRVTESNPLIGIGAAVVVLWMQRQKSLRGSTLAAEYAARQELQGRPVGPDLGLGATSISPEAADDVRDFLASTEVEGGGSALDAWEASPEARPATVPTSTSGMSPAASSAQHRLAAMVSEHDGDEDDPERDGLGR